MVGNTCSQIKDLCKVQMSFRYTCTAFASAQQSSRGLLTIFILHQKVSILLIVGATISGSTCLHVTERNLIWPMVRQPFCNVILFFTSMRLFTLGRVTYQTTELLQGKAQRSSEFPFQTTPSQLRGSCNAVLLDHIQVRLQRRVSVEIQIVCAIAKKLLVDIDADR